MMMGKRVSKPAQPVFLLLLVFVLKLIHHRSWGIKRNLLLGLKGHCKYISVTLQSVRGENS